jgi:hypothetical protein
MSVLKYGRIALAGALIVVLSSLTQFVCSTWLLMSEPLIQTMVLTALSMCGSGFAALMELSDRHRQAARANSSCAAPPWGAQRCNASFAREGHRATSLLPGRPKIRNVRREIPTLLQYSPHCVSYKNPLLTCASFHKGRRENTMDSALPVNKRHEYREEAQSIRAIASEMKNPKIQVQLLLIASLYDKLADIAEHTHHAVPPWAVGCRTGKN